jgi:hypothetical protein
MCYQLTNRIFISWKTIYKKAKKQKIVLNNALWRMRGNKRHFALVAWHSEARHIGFVRYTLEKHLQVRNNDNSDGNIEQLHAIHKFRGTL